MDLQKKNNGFVSCFVLALGLTVLMIAMGSARLAQDQLKEAEAYCDTVTAAYYAENLLHLYWDEMSAQPCRAMPLSEKKDGRKFYPSAPTAADLEVHCVTGVHNSTFEGTAQASCTMKLSGMTRTCSIRFLVRPGEGDAGDQIVITRISY